MDAAARKKKRKVKLELDEDDYDLLEDNQVTGFDARRRRGSKGVRSRQAAVDKPKTVKDVERDLFGDDSDEEAAAAKVVKPKPEAAPVPEEDFAADDDSEGPLLFIEREEGEQPRRKIGPMAGRERAAAGRRGHLGHLGELQSRQARRRGRGGHEEESEEESEEEEDGAAPRTARRRAGEAGEAAKAKKKKARRGGAGVRRVGSVFEPSLVRDRCSRAGRQIRREDGERLQIPPPGARRGRRRRGEVDLRPHEGIGLSGASHLRRRPPARRVPGRRVQRITNRGSTNVTTAG